MTTTHHPTRARDRPATPDETREHEMREQEMTMAETTSAPTPPASLGFWRGDRVRVAHADAWPVDELPTGATGTVVEGDPELGYRIALDTPIEMVDAGLGTPWMLTVAWADTARLERIEETTDEQ